MDDPDRSALHPHLTAGQAETLAAMVDVIVPADEYPNGTEAGVLNYFGTHFAGDLAGQLAHYRLGLDTVEAEAHARYGSPLSAMPVDDRHRLMQVIESGEVRASWPVDPRVFFDAVVGHVMEGYYGDPSNGGNRDAVSWRMIGFRVDD